MTRIMYDSVNYVGIPANASMVAGYVDGLYANIHLMRSHFPKAIVVGIAVFAHTDDGQVLDVERGDASPSEAPGWVQMRRRAGCDPTVYCSLSLWPQVRDAFYAAHIAEPHYWVADWDGNTTIPTGAVAKQYRNTPHYDISVVADHWPGVDSNQPQPRPTPSSATYVVRKGDTLSGIAAKYGISLNAIEHLNPQIKNPNLIYPGQVIRVSGPVPPIKATYIVRKGDTLSGIASAHNMTLTALEKLNPQIKNPNLIYPGDRIYL